jgi:hypothetical protein
MPSFETTDKPWFGPRSRARSMLEARRSVVTPREALHAFAAILGSAFDAVQFVRFIDYTHRGEGFRYTIAVVFTRSDAIARQTVYDAAADCVAVTGWYPLVQGERLASRRTRAAFLAQGAWTARLPELRGPLTAIDLAVPGEGGGCSIRARMGGSSLLLDTGFPNQLVLTQSDRTALLTHTHNDHAGGFLSGATGKLPVIMSTSTAQLLAARQAAIEGRLHAQAVLAEADHPLILGPEATIHPFAVPHLPGAVGYELRVEERSLFFTGDVCLRTARHDFVAKFVERVDTSPSACRYVLLDATMAGRALGASAAPAADALLATAGRADIVITAVAPDHLLYAYLDLFHRLRSDDYVRDSTYLVATWRLRRTFEVVHAAFIGREHTRLDPFLLDQYGAAMSAWGESRWLIWLDDKLRVPPDRRRIWFVLNDELNRVHPQGHAVLVHIGRGKLPPPRWAHRVPELDTSPWTLHSDERTLADTARRLAPAGTVILFHNYENRLKRFVARHHLDAYALGSDGLELV